jgi:dTMP kinase
MFFCFDGIDGVGKSTQAKRFAQWLREQGREVVECRDPGSTAVGESVRGILLDTRSTISLRTEALLYMAARAQMVEEVIRPALAAGKIVVSDRYLLSNVVYQGYGGGLDVDVLWRLGEIAIDGVRPDATFLLDMETAAAHGRLNRQLDRMEQRGDDFRERLRLGFLAEAAKPERRIVVISADGTVEAVQERIRRHAIRILGATPSP